MKNRRAFTFIELTVAVTIFSIIAISIYSTFRAGIKIWSRSNSVIEANQTKRVFFDKISLDMKNAVDYPGIGFEGEPQRVSFMTLINVYDAESESHTELAKAVYYYDGVKKKIRRKLATKNEGFNDAYAKESELIGDIGEKDFGFSYCYKSKSADAAHVWNDRWDDKEKAPRAVKVRVSDFEKTIFVPAGEMSEIKE